MATASSVAGKPAALALLLLLFLQVLPCSFGGVPPAFSTDAPVTIGPVDVCGGPDSGAHHADYLWLPSPAPLSPAVRGSVTGPSSHESELSEGFPLSVFRPPRPMRRPAREPGEV